MNLKDLASIVAFARLLGIKGTDEEIINTFIEHYMNAQTSLNQYKLPKGLKRNKINFFTDFQSQDWAEVIIFIGLFIFIAVILLPATK